MLAQGDDIIPIPGTKRRTYLDENIDALAVTLSVEELKTIDHILPHGTTAGPRYAAAAMKALNH